MKMKDWDLLKRLLFFLFFFLLCGQVWADQVDTLRPASDAVPTAFSSVPSHTSDSLWMQADDPGGVSDGDTTYNYTATPNAIWVWVQAYWSTTNVIDSVALVFRARKTGAIGASVITLGRRGWTLEGGWYWCAFHGSTDTVSYATTASYANYRISWLYDPCQAGSVPWDTLQLSVGDWAILVESISIQHRTTQSYIVVYSHAAGGKRKVGGIVQDEDNKGLIEGGIAR